MKVFRLIFKTIHNQPVGDSRTNNHNELKIIIKKHQVQLQQFSNYLMSVSSCSSSPPSSSPVSSLSRKVIIFQRWTRPPTTLSTPSTSTQHNSTPLFEEEEEESEEAQSPISKRRKTTTVEPNTLKPLPPQSCSSPSPTSSFHSGRICPLNNVDWLHYGAVIGKTQLSFVGCSRASFGTGFLVQERMFK